MSRRPRWIKRSLAALGLCAVALVPQGARADIYSYTDADGVIHFSNQPGSDGRYKLYLKGSAKAKRKNQSVLPVAPSDKSVERFTRYSVWIRQAATLYQIPEELIRAVMKVESDYDPR